MTRLRRMLVTAMVTTATLGAASGMALAVTAAPAKASASARAAWECPLGTICLYDFAGGIGRFYVATDGCWFDNIGLSGGGDRASSMFNRTRHRVNLANWNGRAWEHLVHANPGERVNLSAAANDRADAVHVIC